MTRRPPSIDAEPLLWDGHALQGSAPGRLAEVWVPARFLSLRRESLPTAAVAAQKAAARLRADRAFAPLGPVNVEALFHPARQGTSEVLLMALPRPVLEAIRKAAQAKGVGLRAVRVAELMKPVPAGCVVTIGGAQAEEASLMVMESGRLAAIASLGPKDDAGFSARLRRERLRLGVGEDAPGGPACGARLDLLHPGLAAAQPLLARSGVRLGLLAAAAVLAATVGLLFTANDAVQARDSAKAQWEEISPEAAELANCKADIKSLAPWFEARPDTAPCLRALCGALPPLGAPAQVRLARVRQAPGETTVVEGVAADRAQMLAFCGRLRQDASVGEAEIRSFRSQSRDSSEVIFELGLREVAPARNGASAKGGKP